ncbi:MAG: HET-C-related protein, partial [Bacteroidales bacterium]
SIKISSSQPGSGMNTFSSQSILPPPLASYTGIVHSARIESRLRFQPTKKEKELKKQIAVQEDEAPVKSSEVNLRSNFAWKQLIDLAKSDGKWLFKFRMAEIFGKDVSQEAVNKLYDDCMDASLSNPPIEVCENTIYGLMAAYHTKTNKIYVSRYSIEAAATHNHARHKLLVALVEEFGHHIDWLLRCHYAGSANHDSKGDEGARFAYRGMCRVLYLNFHELRAVPFAQAQTPDGIFNLTWDIAAAHDALETYTKERQYGMDDHVRGYEGFKVENLELRGGFGHENIQRRAIRESGIKSLQDSKNIQYLYRGSWLKDYIQLITPLFFDPVVVLKQQNNETLQGYYKKLAPDPAQLKEFLNDIIRILAIKEYFTGTSKEHVTRAEYYKNPTLWRDIVDHEKDGLIPGFANGAGVSLPYDHCDNPKGMVTSQKLQTAGFNKAITTEELEIDKSLGMKHYIRSNASQKQKESWGTKCIYDYLTSTLECINSTHNAESSVYNHITSTSGYGASPYKSVNPSFGYMPSQPELLNVYKPTPPQLVKLGGVLHTIQDFYAHSNFAETYLVKTWFDKVITWCAESDRCRNYSTRQLNYYQIDKNMQFDETVLRKMINQYNLKGKKERLFRQDGSYFYKKALYTPIVTGTYDMEDLISTALIMLGEKKFPLEPQLPSRGMEPGILSANDLLLLLFCRYFDQLKDSGNHTAEELLNLFFDIRDKWIETKKLLEKLPDFIKEQIEWIDRKLIENLKQAIRIYKNIAAHYLLIMLARSVKEYQMTLKKRLSAFGTNPINDTDVINGIYGHGTNPSHTMLAKDDVFHPLNQLAGEMAVDATTILLKALSDGNEENSLDRILVHPLCTRIFDTKTLVWAKSHPVNLLRCCVCSESLEGIRMSLNLVNKARLRLNKLSGSHPVIGTNRAAKSSNSTDAMSQKNDLDTIGTSHKELKKDLITALTSYNSAGNYYRELDSQTFIEFLSLYYPKVKDSGSSRQALKKIWQDEAAKAAERTKTDLSKKFDFIEHAYNQAKLHLQST